MLISALYAFCEQIQRKRILRRVSVQNGAVPTFISKKANRSKNWRVDPIPRRLVNRKLDLGDISPARTELLVAALNSNVQGIQVGCSVAYSSIH